MIVAQSSSVDPAASSRKEKNERRLEILDPRKLGKWDFLAARLKGFTFFHSTAWACVLYDTYGYKPVYLTIWDGLEIQSALPVMEVETWATKRRGVSLPFSDTCELLGQGNRELFAELSRYGEKRGWKYWETRDAAPEHSEASILFYGHTLNLRNGEKAAYDAFDSSTRRAIRKSEKSNLTVESVNDLKGIEIFYELHCKTRQKHGVLPQGFSFFRNIHRNVVEKGHGLVVIAKADGVPVAANVYFHSAQTRKAVYKFGASDEAYQEARGSNLVMWNAIQWYIANGYEELDFGRSNVGAEGLRRYKAGWGTTERMIRYCRYDLQRGKYVTRSAEIERMQRVVRIAPPSIARFLGGFLYRHIA